MLLTLAARLAVMGILAGALTSAMGQEPKILGETSSLAWPVPLFSSQGIHQCDADGNLYFRTSLALNESAC